VFAREVTPGLTGLVKKLEAATAAHSDKKFKAVVVLLTTDDKAEAKLKELAEKEKLKNVILAVEGAEGPGKYNIAKDAEVTVLLYEKKKVKKNYVFEKGKLTDKEVDAVVGAVKEILPEK
jgi:hypothetical protein